ncbi:hypothetical protein PN36_11980 [Candidatus Thiomargarita nelsonii]|uniref:Uncharacterized protein n=1 Tax=Candidatus Thiomargarita nelsonii TaxID=1003181 RepID=A0A0A6PGU7_9GAMM|nr:hypothetical protein PN36_11980 [Candidatus Thiomargarita nelsonii]
MLISRIFTILFPIFAIVAVGYLYARLRPIDISAVNRLNMAIFTPALLFSVLCDKSFMFVNTGNMGIPVALFAFGDIGLPVAMLFLMITAILGATLGIYIVSQRASVLELLKEPLIQAAIAGVSLTKVSLPALWLKPIEMLGNCGVRLSFMG